MRILVCVKRVPAPGSRINITPDGQSVDTAHLGFTTSPHEECAVEAAVQLIEQHGGTATVLTLGPPAAEEQLRYALSVGMTEGVLLITDEVEWDPQRTAGAIARAVRELEGDTPFDLVLFGNESADSAGFQVGIRAAYLLGRPMVNGAKHLDVDRDARVVHLRRGSDGGQEGYELPMPAVVGVKEGLNLPRYPTMKGRLASKKATITSLEATAEAGGLRRVVLRRPAEKEATTVVLGYGADAATEVVDVLEELGVLT